MLLGFINNIDPDLVRIGPFAIRFYGIVYALGFLLVSYLLSNAASKGRIKNLTKERAENLVMLSMIFGILGARLFHVITDFHLYKDNLIGVFAIWNGGLGYYGGLAGGLLAIHLYCRKHGIRFFEVTDSLVMPFALITAFGRIANFTNSEIIGPPTDLPWCVVFQRIDDVCRHPAQLYQSVSMFVLFFSLLWFSHHKLSHRKGSMTWLFVTGYGLFRFITDFMRIDYSTYVLGLSITQIISLIVTILGAWMLWRKK